jgi:hypothetical protein
MSSFTSNFAFQPISQHHVTSGINLVEAIVCIIAANSVGIIMNFALASSFAISSAASFKLRELQVQTRRKRKQTYRYVCCLQPKNSHLKRTPAAVYGRQPFQKPRQAKITLFCDHDSALIYYCSKSRRLTSNTLIFGNCCNVTVQFQFYFVEETIQFY